MIQEYVRVLIFTVFWDVTLCGSCKNRRFGGTWRPHYQADKNWRLPISATLMMVALRSSEPSVLTSSTLRNIPEDGIPDTGIVLHFYFMAGKCDRQRGISLALPLHIHNMTRKCDRQRGISLALPLHIHNITRKCDRQGGISLALPLHIHNMTRKCDRQGGISLALPLHIHNMTRKNE
jgi:hypothetical protein